VAVRLTSPQNPRVRATAALSDRRERRATGLFTVEGAREIDRALAGGFTLVELFHCPQVTSAEANELVTRCRDAEIHDVTEAVFAKLAVRQGSGGVLGVFRQRERHLRDLSLPEDPLILAVQGVEKPGNLGALLRSADGAGAAAVVVLDHALDLYNPNVIRASLGTAFTVPVVATSSAELRDFARTKSLKIVAAALTDDAKEHFQADLTGPTIILLGEEAQGLSADWLRDSDLRVKIPMRGSADSLNVSVSGAILLYEALRQRRSLLK
jgi:RNA methyltransferase, TrmH family